MLKKLFQWLLPSEPSCRPTYGVARSSLWPQVREEHLQKHPVCAVCGGKEDLEVHHRVPVHVAKSLELDFVNLITLCGKKNNCHFIFGHLYDWHSFNRDVFEDSSKMKNKIAERP